MRNKVGELDLLQKYKHNISKRYRGYNRVYQLNTNKINHLQVYQMFNHQNSLQPNYKQSKQKLQIDQIQSMTEIKNNNDVNEMHKNSFSSTNYRQTSLKSPLCIGRIEIINPQIQFQNKFRFRKKPSKEFIQRLNSNEQQLIIRKYEDIGYQIFAPLIKGQKKKTFIMNKKNKTTQNQSEELFKFKIGQNSNNSNIPFILSRKQVTQRINNSTTPLSQKAGKSSKLQKFKQIEKQKSIIMLQKSGDKQTIKSQAFQKLPSLQKSKQKDKNIIENADSLQEKRNNPKFKQVPLLIKFPFNLKNIDSQSYIVIQADSQMILWANRPNNPLEIASLTKIMTFFVVLKIIDEHRIDPKQEKVQINLSATNIGGTSADLLPNQIYTLQNLIYGMMLPSGNDAALSLAIWAGRYCSSNPQDTDTCIKDFVTLMNKHSKQLQLNETKFSNPHGLPNPQSRSSAQDIAKLCAICLKNKFFIQVVSTKIYKCFSLMNDGKKRNNSWQNTNKLLRRQGFIGLKTGITITAGPCLATAYKFKDQTYICVILRAKKVSRRFKQTRKLLNWCLTRLYQDQLTDKEIQTLKKLKKNNIELDSDYSEDQNVFRYDVNNSKQFKKRCDIISQM